ncbi:Dihydroxyacetone kinase 1 [Psilocybe cubensis]|uniref:Dihydroxyacetone kinase n=2 Tax=Psilocybe cubensis TaxID=181762 RepID=A0A8H8CFN5_PSICU|nr:Dihydroxyacetone kinase 1 [Psilocybe cubensis]KAH9475584.1 Dihydroxyacetone kinase 1 [Psilocybe cubensis]
MNTKHLYNSAEGLVLKSLRGAVALNPNVILHEPSKTVYTPIHSPHKQVAVISGGGSGHEPAHAGYTGKGMLAACIAGDIFASPSAKQILKGIGLASSPNSFPQSQKPPAKDLSDSSAPEGSLKPQLDVLAIINNYTGDILNFGLAIEKARGTMPGTRIESVVVADDVSLLPQNRQHALQDSGSGTTNKLVGPRGLGANILVCKILGALAERGASLDVVKAMGDAVVGNLYSIGVGLEHCHVPGHLTEKNRALGKGECEVGLGLHNEPGVRRREIGSPAELIGEMFEMLFRSGARGKEGGIMKGTDEMKLQAECKEGTVLFINNLGGMSQLEMGAVVDDVLQRLALYSIRPKRLYCSSYMTSLNAPGFSISILNLPGTSNAFRSNLGGRISSEESEITVEELLDMPTDAYAWVGARNSWPAHGTDGLGTSHSDHLGSTTNLSSTNDSSIPIRPTDVVDIEESPAGRNDRIQNAIRGACLRVIEIHEQLTEFDTVVGDGDCGDTFKAGALAIMNALDNGSLKIQKYMDSVIYGIAEIIEDVMGGTIGALLAIFLQALAVSVTQDRVEHPNSEVRWGYALQYAKDTLSRYTPAEVGDRTIVDALGPFCATMAHTIVAGANDSSATVEDTNSKDNTWKSLIAMLVEATKQARIGAEKTRGMAAHLGRAAYVASASSSTSTSAGAVELPPDPGAWGVCAILEGFLDGLRT